MLWKKIPSTTFFLRLLFSFCRKTIWAEHWWIDELEILLNWVRAGLTLDEWRVGGGGGIKLNLCWLHFSSARRHLAPTFTFLYNLQSYQWPIVAKICLRLELNCWKGLHCQLHHSHWPILIRTNWCTDLFNFDWLKYFKSPWNWHSINLHIRLS